VPQFHFETNLILNDVLKIVSINQMKNIKKNQRYCAWGNLQTKYTCMCKNTDLKVTILVVLLHVQNGTNKNKEQYRPYRQA